MAIDKPGAIISNTAIELVPTPKRVRVRFCRECVADSDRAALLLEKDHLPVYYFPWDDVRHDLLEASAGRTECGCKGHASYWRVRAGARLAENAVWSYGEPVPEAAPLKGFAAFYWDAMDAWFEEDEEVDVHPRDPYHRIDVRRSSRHVVAAVGGKVFAETRRPTVLFETGLPPRYYVPQLDVRLDCLVPSATRTGCPYKGEARHFHVDAGGTRHEDICWTYPIARLEAARVEGMIGIYQERVDRLLVDGVQQEKPITRWS